MMWNKWKLRDKEIETEFREERTREPLVMRSSLSFRLVVFAFPPGSLVSAPEIAVASLGR